MFVPRTNAHLFDDCSSDDSCTPVGAIVGQDPTEQETDPTTSTDSTTDWTRPGPHRYIGIWIVVGLIIVVIALYLTCARRPRRFFSRHFRRKSLSPKQEMQEVKALGGPFIAPNPLIAQPEKARPKSGRSGHGANFFGGRMVAEHSSSNKYLIQSEWDVQQPQTQANRSSDDHSQKPIYPMRRPPS